MNLKQAISDKAEAAFAASGLQGEPVALALSKRADWGDYQINGAMGAAKKRGQKTRDLAASVAKNLPSGGPIAWAQVAGPGFVNVKVDDGFLRAALDGQEASDRLGAQTPWVGETIALDYSSPNLAKEMHVGHLRSTIIGDALRRLALFFGAKVVPQNHVGDWGTQFGMLLARLESVSGDAADFRISDLEEFYREAKKRFDEDPAFADKSRAYVRDLQSGEERARRAWERFVKLSMEHAQEVYRRLGVMLCGEEPRGESRYNDDLPVIVGDLLKRGIAVERDGTAMVMFPDEVDKETGEPLGFIVRKRGGGYLYSTTDLACVRWNVGQAQATRMWYVVDSRQASHFEHVFATARRAGYLPDSVEALHIPFGTMMGKDGKPFKTRDGGTVKLAALLDEAIERAYRVVREKNPDLGEQEARSIAQCVGLGAVKYADLSKNRLGDYVFDWDEMLSFDGNTAPYLQYAYARTRKMLSKAGDWDKTAPWPLGQAVERELALHLARFEESALEALETQFPHALARYLHKLATVYSRFYEECPILKEDEPLRSGRLRLAALSARTLKLGLSLLGISVLDRM